MTRSVAQGFVLGAWLVAAWGCGTTPPPLYEDLGEHRREIVTASDDAQRYFDQGLRLYFAGRRITAQESFRHAAELDSDCAMCWWGVALSLAPSAGEPAVSDADREQGQVAIARARGLGGEELPANRLLIEALDARYEVEPSAQGGAWADALEEVQREYPGDLDARVLHAEARMLEATLPGDPSAAGRIAAALAEVLEQDPRHPGALVRYLLFDQISELPDAASAADRLRQVAPGVGSSHELAGDLYMRLGRYEDAASCYSDALRADEAMRAGSAPRAGEWIYRSQDAWALAFARMMQGREGEARAAAELAADAARHHDGAASTIGGSASYFRAAPLFVTIRFGRWDRLLDAAMPHERGGFEEIVWLFGRAMALTYSGRPDEADRQRRELVTLAANLELRRDRTPGGNALAELGGVAEGLLNGEIARARGEIERAKTHFARAVAKEDRMQRQEPPDWPISGRHYLGAVELEAGRADEAEQYFRRDLRRHPGNPWSTLGLAQSLEAQGKDEEAAAARSAFAAAWTGDAEPPRDSRW